MRPIREALTKSTRHKARKVAEKELREALYESGDHPPLYDDIAEPQPSPLYTPNPTSRDSTAVPCNMEGSYRLDSVAQYNARHGMAAVAAS